MSNQGNIQNSKDLKGTNILKLLEPHLEVLKDFLIDQVHNLEPELHSIAEYCFNLSGKRLRACLVFLSGWTDSETICDDLIRIAAVIELVHLATLVHDDILDKAVIRRNRLTLSQEYGTNEAILFGDALFAHALKLASDFPSTDVCRHVAEATRRVCAGEIAQTFDSDDTPKTLDQYLRIIELKTSELFSVACYLGALYANSDPDYIQATKEFGKQFGIAYQVYDDLVDFFGDEESIGKTLGTDLNEKRYTLPMITLLDSVSDEEQKVLETVIKTKENAFDTIKELMMKYSIKERVIHHFNEILQKAEESIITFEDTPSVGHLLQVKESIRERAAGL